MLKENITNLPNKAVPNTAGIYLLHDEKTNQFYIGSSVNMRSRIAHHRSLLLANKHPNEKLQQLFLTGDVVFKTLVTFPVAQKSKVREVENYFLEASSVLFENHLINKRQAKTFHLLNG